MLEKPVLARPQPLSTRGRAAVAAATLAAVAIAGILPRVSSPIHRLINVRSNGAQPSYVSLLDDTPVREAARIINGDPKATYFVESESAYGLDLNGATHLYFPPALGVRDAQNVRWILTYHTELQLPQRLEVAWPPQFEDSMRVLRSYRLGPDAMLARVVPR